jgi:hypothetical protein
MAYRVLATSLRGASALACRIEGVLDPKAAFAQMMNLHGQR